ncbi:AAA family ATPase [Amycolatopsis japonica]|uniref:AAA family ATPase n=1 Tax=Amycolatopsis japonica TaxID=208439 RepID=UPI00366EF55D
MSTVAVTPVDSGRSTSSHRFVGRAAQVAKLVRYVTDSDGKNRITCQVTGLGGTGKSALVRHVAECLARQGHFPGGVVLVDFRGCMGPASLDQVTNALVAALGGPESTGAPTVAYHRLLEEKAAASEPILIVMDGVPDADQIRGLLPEQHPHRVLVTARETLPLLSARELDLTVMTVPDALEFLAVVFGVLSPLDRRLRDAPSGALDLIQLCDRLPLALEIAAAILAAEPTLTVAALVVELINPSERVRSLRYGSQALEAVLSASWQRLATRDRQAAELLPLLTLAPGPDFSTATAAALAGEPETRVKAPLRALRQAKLLHLTPNGRWRMDPLVEVYASRLFDRLGQDAHTFVVRVLTYFAETAEMALKCLHNSADLGANAVFANHAEALTWFVNERYGIFVTIQETAPHHDLARRLAHHFSAYLQHTGEASTLVKIRAAVARSLQTTRCTPVELGTALSELSTALAAQGNLDAAMDNGEMAMTILRRAGDPVQEALGWSKFGEVLWRRGRLEGAVDAYQRGVRLLQDAADAHGEAAALNQLGDRQRELWGHDHRYLFLADASHRRAAELFEAGGDQCGWAVSQCYRAQILLSTDRVDEALRQFNHSAAILDMRGHEKEYAEVNQRFAADLVAHGRFTEAAERFRIAAGLFRQLGAFRSEVDALHRSQHLEYLSSDESQPQLAVAAQLFRAVRDFPRLADVLRRRSVQLSRVGKFSEARSSAKEAIGLYRGLGNHKGADAVSQRLGRWELGRANSPAGIQYPCAAPPTAQLRHGRQGRHRLT